ncbi:MAG: hypothetical protein KDK76_02975, partial [Chlamydiia bacterium]|nr:hypothetical protein [Chlamydiia bacterium]
LSKGFDRYHYILSYVSSSTVVKHKNVRILMENGITIFRNGSNGGPSRSINDLVLRCLNCSSQVCKPLKD